MKQNDLVSIITPLYNNQDFIETTIKSVQSQSYSNFEMIIVDDCSTDKSGELVKKICEDDKRIRLITLKENSGAAIARNTAVLESQGRYIAFLDADDLWYPNKLEKQLNYMEERKSYFSCASYDVISEAGEPLGKTVVMKDRFTYDILLKNNLIQTVGVMIDTQKVGKDLLIVPNVRKGQDLILWLQILKKGFSCDGIKEVLCSYRRVSGSLSSNKVKAIKRTWYIYRDVEHLPLFKALNYFFRYAMLAVWKRSKG